MVSWIRGIVLWCLIFVELIIFAFFGPGLWCCYLLCSSLSIYIVG